MEVSTVVIDNGAYTMRAGLGGDSEPSCIIPSVVGRPKSSGSRDVFVGSDVLSQSIPLSLKCPIENRIITNFDDIEKVWGHIFANAIHLNPEEHPILMTESPENTKPAREKALQIMMETYKVPAFYSTYPEVLSLYSAGMTTGTVIDAGETVIHILPVYECFAMTHVQSRLDIGGRHINTYLKKLLVQSGIELQASNEREILRDIKEKFCYVAVDIDAELQKVEHANEIEKQFVLQEGTTIQLAAQRFRCPEPIFEPQLISVASPGVAELLVQTVSRTEDLRTQMFSSVMLSGGTSMFNGFAARIEREVVKWAGGTTVKVIALPNRKNSAWIGGSVLVSLATFSQMWVTKREYDETGPSIVHLKCF
jgi:actin beta/gamma 1